MRGQATENSMIFLRIFVMAFDRGRRKIYHARLMYARPFIDSLDFARNGKQISGELPVVALPRLLDTLEHMQGNLSYTVHGGVDEQGTHFLDVSLAGHCQLRCQRCLGGLDHLVNINTRLLLRDQKSLDALNDADDEFDSILADTHMNILDLLEDEVLLSLPIAPRHELGACQAKADVNAAPRGEKYPFAVLDSLKRN
jgi:uncharacterized protein